jgi:cytochrome P450
MISARDDDRLTDTEMIAMTVALGLTGPQTTASFIGNGILALLTHPEQLVLLRNKPDLMPRAVDEMLRWAGSTQVVPRVRYAAEDVQFDEVTVRKGDALWLVRAGANHDPRKFDEPDRLDITREPDRRAEAHIAFGGGSHRCLGAAQASQDAEVAFETLFRRFPNLTLAVDPNKLEHEHMAFRYRLKTLPVRL